MITEKCAQYNALLQKPIMVGKILTLWLAIVFLIAILFIWKKLKLKKYALQTTMIGIAFLLFAYISLTYPYQKDIDENAYIVYTGEFFVVEHNAPRNWMYIKYPSSDKIIRYETLCDDDFIENETGYEGTIVYSERSKCIVDIIIP